MMAMGQEGYTEKAKLLMDTTTKLKQGISQIQVMFLL